MAKLHHLLGRVFDKIEKGVVRLYDVFTGEISHKLESEFRNKLLEEAVKAAPDGSENLDKFTGFGNPSFSRFGERPSQRLGLIPIREGLYVESIQEPLSDEALAVYDLDLHFRKLSFRLMTTSGHAKFFTTCVPPVREKPGTTPHAIFPRNFKYLAFNSYGRDILARSVGFGEGAKKQAIVIGPENRIKSDFVVEAYRKLEEYVQEKLAEVFGI